MSESEILSLIGLRFLGLTPFDDWGQFFRELGHGGRFYRRILRNDVGVTVYLDPMMPGQDHCHVEIKGSALELVSAGQIAAFFRDLGELQREWSVTRLDCAWDHVPFTPRMVWEAGQRGDVRASLRRVPGWMKHYEGLPGEESGEDEGDDEGQGETTYVGCRKSSRHLCVYDRRGYTRCELRDKDRFRATLLMREFLESPESDWSRKALGFLVNFVSFCEAGSDSCVSRRRELPWWAAFVQGAKRVKLKLQKVVSDLVQTGRRLIHRATKDLAMALSFAPVEFVRQELELARERMGEELRARAAQIRHAFNAAVTELGQSIVFESTWEDESPCDVYRKFGRAVLPPAPF